MGDLNRFEKYGRQIWLDEHDDFFDYEDFHETQDSFNDGKFIISTRRIPNLITIYSLLPCHSLPGYGFYHNIRPNYLQLKQLECPPVQYRLPKSSKTHIYNNGDSPIPDENTLEKHNVHKISNFIVVYKKDGEEIQVWLHKNRFEKKFCIKHMDFPGMLGDNHDSHVC